MSSSALHALAEIAVAASMALLLVGALRKPLRRIAGARIAYWLWLSVPANVLAIWVPVSRSIQVATLPQPLTGVISHALVTAASNGNAGGKVVPALVILIIWLSGVCLMAAWFSIRQRIFLRSLGGLASGADGILRSDRIGAPMLVGAWRPRVVVPADFEARYPAEDRVLMLVHEQAHRERGDAVANLIATAWLCLFWFNPLMYWGIGRFRFDQELACDAYVLARSGSNKKRYASALLKAQLTSESDWRVPVGCHWQSSHPLRERITMLKLPSPGRTRRLGGVAVAVALTACSVYAISSSFAQVPVQAASAAGRSTNGAMAAEQTFSIDAKDTNTRDVLGMIARKSKQNILVSDQVNGKMTVHLKDVTWRQALNIVVLSQGLVARQAGDVTLVGVRH